MTAESRDEWMTSRRIDLDNPPEEAKLYVELYERTKKELDLLKQDLASRKPHISVKVSHDEIDKWCVKLYRLSGIEVVRFDGANGLVNVPNKYVALLDALHLALVNLSEGLPLPEFAPVEPKKPKKKKKTKRV